MGSFNPFNVIMMLYVTFSALNLPPTPTTSEEREVKNRIENMLQEIQDGKLFEMDEEETLDFVNPYDIPEAERIDLYEEENDDHLNYPKEITCIPDVTFDYKRNAVEYWNSGKTGRRSLNGVKQKYRQVTSIRQLRRWEEQLEEGGSRLEKLRRISEYTLNNFQRALEKGMIIHDVDIVRWASRAQEEENVTGFKASDRWVAKFKRRYNIVFRKITKFITKKSLISKEELEKKCDAFIENVKEYITQYGLDNIYNSDQSGFQLELHAGRSLAVKGTKKVESVVQSISSTTHSYTIQPIVSASGRLLSPLFIVLKEPSGTFGPRVQETIFQSPNIFVMSSKSGKLTSQHFQTWLTEVFFPNVGPKSVLLLDSWTGHCLGILQESRPTSVHDIILLTIPAGTTGKIQPLDVYGFRLWKNFIKHFSDMVMLLDLAINLHLRNNILKLQSLTHNQFSSPRFVNLFKYAWFKSGYVANRPEEFETPVDFCFKNHSKATCDICGATAIITCSWCKKSLCITHFFHDHHLCDEYVP